MSDTDILKILKHFEVNEAHLVADLTRAIESFKTGNARTPALSPRIPRMIKEAWLLASVEYQTPQIRSGQVLLALLDSDDFSRMLISSSDTLKKISVETLKSSLMDVTAGSGEDAGGAVQPSAAGDATGRPAGLPEPRRWISTPSTSRIGPRRGRSIRCWAVISKSARWWTF